VEKCLFAQIYKTMLPSDYGELRVKLIRNGEDFWHVIDALCDDKSGFMNNRDVIADAFINRRLYGMTVAETEEMFERRAWKDDIFCPGSWYLLPSLCIVTGNIANIIWTHSRAQRNGIAKMFIDRLGIQRAENPLQESISFWEKNGISDFVWT